jgi:hypothetical protein
MLDEAAAETWRGLVRNRGKEIDARVKQMEKIDALDFAPFLTMSIGERTAAEEIYKSVPAGGAGCLLVLFFLNLLAAWNQEPDHPSMRTLQLAGETEDSYIEFAPASPCRLLKVT